MHVEIETVFHRRPNRTLVVEIPGAEQPDARVVLAAHVQEPGANDNASGCGTLLAAALAIHGAVRSGALPPPRRTITFLWVDEIRGSEQWLTDNAATVKQVLAMLSLDMTGQDTAKTGGTFLIEKEPDPSALWDRPSDPHSEWGAGKVDASRSSMSMPQLRPKLHRHSTPAEPARSPFRSTWQTDPPSIERVTTCAADSVRSRFS